MTKYAFVIDREVRVSERKRATTIERSFSDWRDSLDETNERFDVYYSILKFAPWIKSMSVEDDHGNTIRRVDCAGNNN